MASILIVDGFPVFVKTPVSSDLIINVHGGIRPDTTTVVETCTPDPDSFSHGADGSSDRDLRRLVIQSMYAFKQFILCD